MVPSSHPEPSHREPSHPEPSRPTGPEAPLFSVLVPTKRRPSMLAVALRSVLDRGFEDVEVVVVDDDPERSAEPVVAAFEDPRLRYLRNTHAPGAAGARNCAAEAARGRFLAFLDDDDAFAPGKLERQRRALETLAPDVVLLFGGWQRYDFAAGRPTGTGPSRHGGWVFEDLMLGNFVANLCTVVVPRAVFERVGGFDEAFPSLEDMDFYLRLARLGPFAYLPDVLAYRRETPTERMSATPALELKGYRLLYRRHADAFRARPRAHHRHAARTFLAACGAGDTRAALAALPWFLAGAVVDPPHLVHLLRRELRHRRTHRGPAPTRDRRALG